jgi:lipopolysaccharide biosynthesis glycosyltransferase
MLASVQRTNPGLPVAVFDCGLSDGERCHLERLGAIVISMPKRYVPRPTTVHGTSYNETIFALMFLGLLPFDRIVHLDADTIVLGSLGPLVDSLDIVDFVGVWDYPPLTLADHVGDDAERQQASSLFGITDIDFDSYGFNAGIFSITKSAYARIRPLMEAIYDSPLLLPLRDQTILNMALISGRLSCAKPLPLHFNFRHCFRRSPQTRWDRVEAHGDLAIPRFGDELVRIVHFIGPDKPWHKSFPDDTEARYVWRQFDRR